MELTYIYKIFNTIPITKYITPFLTSPAYAIPRPVKIKDIIIARIMLFEPLLDLTDLVFFSISVPNVLPHLLQKVAESEFQHPSVDKT